VRWYNWSLSHNTNIYSEDGNRLQQGDSKDAISQPVGKEKLQLTPDSKPSSVHRTLSSGGIYYDKSEQFVIYVDTDHVSITYFSSTMFWWKYLNASNTWVQVQSRWDRFKCINNVLYCLFLYPSTFHSLFYLV